MGMEEYKNKTIQDLYNRKSTRVFQDREISAEDKEAILRAAIMAPTAGNQQLYTILDIKEQKVKNRLAQTCDNQAFIAKAKMILIFCADYQRWYEGFVLAGCEPRKPREGEFLLGVNDALIAAQNTVVAAESLGIGSCYIGDIMENYEIHKDLLGLPKYVFPATMLVFGYPTQQQKDRKKPKRLPIEYIVHENSYNSFNKESLEKIFTFAADGEDYKMWLNKFCQRKYHTDFSLEMTRSIKQYLKNLG